MADWSEAHDGAASPSTVSVPHAPKLSPTRSPSQAQKHLTCSQCNRSFTRPSHLDRHRLTHLPASHKNLIPCPRCHRTFARRDVMLRHLRATHHVTQSNARSVQKSCARCVAKKLKCERTQPCRACASSQSVCEYLAGTSPNNAFDDDHVTSSTLGDMDFSPNLGGSPWNQSSLQQASDADEGIRHMVGANGDLPMQALRTPESTNEDAGFAPSRARDGTERPVAQPLGANVPLGASPFAFQSSGANLFSSGEEDMALCPSETGVSPTYFGLLQPELRTHGFDWLGFDMPGFDFEQPWSAQPDHGMQSAGQDSYYQQDGEVGTPAGPRPSLPPDTLPETTTTSRASPVLRPMEPQQVNQSWPFDQFRAQDAAPHRYVLPPLKDVLQNTYHTGQAPGHTRIDDFVQLLSDQTLPPLGSIQRAGVRQAFSEFQRLLDLYFDRFHDIQAIIHKPTWNMAACPTVLLTAMACIGALLSNDKRDAELSSALSDICMPMIIWLGASDGTNYADVSYLNALCIHQIYSLGSGNRQLYQNADRSRGILIGSLRGIGLLSSPWSNTDEDTAELALSTSDDSAAVVREWHAWIKTEQERRAAWAAFEYDCSLCTLTSRRGAVDLGELPRKLPCIESLWNAASPQAWLALRSRLSPASFSPNLFVTLKSCLAGKEVDFTLGSWAKRLCAQVLGRLLWDLKELEVVAMPSRLGLNSLLNPYQESKRSILTALDMLRNLTASPASTPDLITYSITGLLGHYSHLYAADDVMDIVVYIVRNLMSQDPKQQRSLELARKRLRSIFARDPQAVRTLVWHSAQIVAIANEYLVSAPCAVMRVFMGYIFLLSYSAYGPHNPEPGERASVKLDSSIDSHPQRAAIEGWIRTGGPASVGSVEDICGPGRISAMSRDAQSIMQKLHCWGLADKFTRILSTIGVKGL